MPRIVTSLVLDASPDAIWSVLADWPAYGEWCPLIPKIRGEARLGGDVDIKLQLGALAAPIDATFGDGRCRFVHGEVFTGPGFRLPWSLLKPRLERAYADFNQALAERVEAQAKA